MAVKSGSLIHDFEYLEREFVRDARVKHVGHAVYEDVTRLFPLQGGIQAFGEQLYDVWIFFVAGD